MATAASKVPPMAESCQRFFVAGISRSITSDDLRTHFSRFGNVLESRVQRDVTGLSLGYGWIGFDKPCPSLLDIEHRINGQVLDVQIPRSRQQNAGVAQVVAPIKDNVARPIVPVAQSQVVPAAHHERSDRKRSRSNSRTRRSRSRSHDRDRSSRGDRSDERAIDRTDRRPPPPGPPPAAPQEAVRATPISYPAHQAPAPNRQPVALPPPQPPLGSFNESEFFVCIPSSLCPPHYMRDPRVLFVTMEPNGTFRQMQLPLGNAQTFPQPPPLPQTYQRNYPSAAAPPNHPGPRYY
ncbi:unnamed protein product [Bodo saltans]|uniref:RRM domain-containing protein n=1 Tax=Bodo saltans TaxID=75058 RepID=A0A0S4KFG1_BODSA|nr:unnamed protein product [Bodo saltans]|eukprot:CUI14392.1 unnamed protein product [Bodo saltans]